MALAQKNPLAFLTKNKHDNLISKIHIKLYHAQNAKAVVA